MTAELVTHYKRSALDERASCGRDLYAARWTLDPARVTCINCSKNVAVIRAKLAKQKGAKANA